MFVKTLSINDVCRIHDALCEDFAKEKMDPIFPPGVRSMALLESAVNRQHVGSGATRKYPTIPQNAATLCFGLCNNHPFHNGNKRTALVAMLAHLDANKSTLVGTKQEELYDVMIALASNEMVAYCARGGRVSLSSGTRNSADAEVQALAAWLEPRLQRVKRGERSVTYRELRAILREFGFEITPIAGNQAEIAKLVERRRAFRSPATKRQVVGRIGYHSEGEQVSMAVLKSVRKLTGLREEDGCDSEAFYSGGPTFDVFINKYRTILRRLASN